jgi:hypothetical protein
MLLAAVAHFGGRIFENSCLSSEGLLLAQVGMDLLFCFGKIYGLVALPQTNTLEPILL